METKYCQTTNFREAVSPITGRTLRINLDPSRVFVPEDLSLEELHKAVDEVRASWKNPQTWKRHATEIKPAILSFGNTRTVADVTKCIDELFEVTLRADDLKGVRHKLRFWLSRLWSRGLIALPLSLPINGHDHCPVDVNAVGDRQAAWANEVANHYGSAVGRMRLKSILLRIACVTQGVQELGDLTPMTVNRATYVTRGRHDGRMVKALIRAQAQHCGDRFATIPSDWGLANRKGRAKSDPEYKWVTVQAPALEQWRSALADWTKTRRVVGSTVRFAEFFLAYLLDHPSITRDPVEYCRRDYSSPVSFQDRSSSRNADKRSHYSLNNLGAEFFDWFLGNRLSAPDDFGRPIPSPEHWNPICRLRGPGHPATTFRDAMPIRYINELITIINENDFAWPRTLEADYVRWFDPVTRNWQVVWCPVRASVVLLKLFLPLRTFQIRVSDSGEMDSERFEAGLWAKNPGALAPKEGRIVAKGLLRKFTDPLTGQVYTGFFINTNKTADRLKDERDCGYEIPWQHQRAIEVVAAMRKWQERYNPISGPTNWADLHDLPICMSRLLQDRRKMLNCFLFRDPKGTYRNEPVTDGRTQVFWCALLQELERRVEKRGEKLANGEPIRFFKRKPKYKGETVPPVYDLHTLRVSLLTALATEGGVPLHVLSKCVAGHASILMTMYYVKLNAPYVTEQLAEAQHKISAEEQKNFVRFLQAASYKDIECSVATNGPDGLEALKGTQPGSWVIGDRGICPVGCALCHKGGPKTTGNSTDNDNGPVPGGPKNCMRCRFFVTGPAFLVGLVAHFNGNGVQMLEAAKHFRARQKEINELEDEQIAAERQGKAFRRLDQLDLAYERMTQCAMELDQIAHNSHATYALVERCRVLLKKKRSEPTEGHEVSLVLAGKLSDLDVAVRETTDFDLFNAVCQVARIYPSQASTLASFKRAKIVDTMLALNGRKPVFATLSEEETIAVGNELTNLLLARVGRADTLALMEGKKLLSACGMSEEMDALLEQRLGKPLTLQALKNHAGAVTQIQ